MREDHIQHNASGCVDTVVDSVLKKEWNGKARVKEDYKYQEMTKIIKAVLASNNYVLDGPISLISLESGRKRRIYQYEIII